jgi:hypothetical protein
LVTRKHLPRVQTEGLRMNRKLAGWCLYHAAWPTSAGGIRTRCRVFGRQVH